MVELLRFWPIVVAFAGLRVAGARECEILRPFPSAEGVKSWV